MADIGAAEHFSWTRTVSASAAVWSITGVVLVVLISLALVVRSWILVLVAAIVVIPLVVMGSIRVTVDRSGVTLRSALGWSRMHIGADDIDHADVTDVRAIGDFGGYGYRVSVHGKLKGAKGFVLRSGPAMIVSRVDGRRDVIVVDDAATAAGLVNHVVRHGGPDRRRPAG